MPIHALSRQTEIIHFLTCSCDFFDFVANNHVKVVFHMVDSSKADKFISVLGDHEFLIRKVCRAYAYTKEDGEDLYQDIIIQLWRSFDSYDLSYKYSTWIYRIALNVSISRLRKQKKRDEKEVERRLYTTARDKLESQELIDQLYAFIHEMRPLDRALLLLYLEDKSHTEISEILGISKSNVGTKIGRLKTHLQERFNQKK